jgi:hypothetical protein
MVVSFLAAVLFETGNNEEAESLRESLIERAEKEYIPASCFIGYYLYRGDHHQACRWVERAIQEKDVWLPLMIKIPIKEYRIPNEPRYAELMKNTGLERIFQND